jgi:MYXO-CTERM domain-containing protein
MFVRNPIGSRHLIHIVWPLVLTCLALLAPGAAWAQMGGSSGTAGLSTSDFTFYLELYDSSQKVWAPMNATQQQYFFNRARCECVGDASNYSGHVKIAIQPASGTAQKIQTLLAANDVSMGAGRLYAGSNAINCLGPQEYVGDISAFCTNLLDPSNYNQSFPMTEFMSKRVYESPPIPVAWIYGSETSCGASRTCDATSVCASPLESQTIFLWVQTTGNNYPDTTELSFSLNLNGELQYGPTNVTAVGDNASLVVDWSWPAGITPSADPNFLGVQVFCQREPGVQVFPSGTYAPSYLTAASLCPNAVPATSVYGAFANLDPRYLCSGLLPSAATSYRIPYLQHGIAYSVGVAAVDRYGNINGIADVVSATPTASATPDASEAPTAQIVYSAGCSCSLTDGPGSGRGIACFGFLAIGLFWRIRRRR